MQPFAARVIAWQRIHGRTGLPWQGRDPYRVWVSEIMLQQTQVATVVPYYERFVARFADLPALAQAPLEDVMRLWAGLGYYSRARNLHACAQQLVRDCGGSFPGSARALEALPGIGRSTAAAIAAFCFDERVPILDGNAKRLFARHAGIDGDPASRAVETRMWQRALELLPAAQDMPAYTQGVMDLGATVCTRTTPSCAVCPVREDCHALVHQRVDRLPAPRARKRLPTREACFLLAVARDAVLLEQRPPVGIWGGLLAPPQFADSKSLRKALGALAADAQVRALRPRRHGFTHFTLAYTPYLAQLDAPPSRVGEPNQRWVSLREAGSAPLPAPMRALLSEVHELLARERGRAT
ncbi:MAG TPA: A/G-specific adenine glycosylase [Burkholderiaceae bacterium]|nr:A/G-specific adenine glycosylase [Burkholderiaceae bacterium]